jgi:hypothetical protein
MYESDDYDYKDYTSENEEIPRDFEYNQSLSGHAHGHRRKVKKDQRNIVSHDDRGKRVRRVKKDKK